MDEARPCPKCSRQYSWIVPPYKPRRLERVYVECWYCHHRSKPRFGRRRAIKEWNKERRGNFVRKTQTENSI